MYYYYYLLFLANPTHLPLKLKLNNICRIIISTKPTLFLNLFFYVYVFLFFYVYVLCLFFNRLAWKERASSQQLTLCLERTGSSLTLCARLCTGL